jgi:hypothetical protein
MSLSVGRDPPRSITACGVLLDELVAALHFDHLRAVAEYLVEVR